MKKTLISRLGAGLLALILCTGVATPPATSQAPAVPPSALQGAWQIGDTSLRISVNMAEARGMFVEVGQGAGALGFKPGELSFVATVTESYLYGVQTTRYGGTCYPDGRKVPMMGRMTPDGQALAIHFYNVRLDANCRDTGEYTVSQELWQRLPERR